MSCYHPLLAIRRRPGDQFKIIGNVPDFEYFRKSIYPDYECMPVPCGQCKGCRLDKSRSWADRMCLEFDHTKKACFLTLTYDNDHLPLNEDLITDPFTGEIYPTLVKEDLSRFMKDLRGNKHFDGREIRFYGAGEYGDLRGRPHLHVILFGVDLLDFDWPQDNSPLVVDGKNELGSLYYRCRILEDTIWKKGRCCIAEFSWETAAYTARYVQKKLTGNLSSFYTERGQEPPFSLMSRMPGIAGHYLTDHPDKNILEVNTFSVNGKVKHIPDYLYGKLFENDPDGYEAFKDQRRSYASDLMLLRLQQTNLSFEELLANEEDHFNKVSSLLKRPLD